MPRGRISLQPTGGGDHRGRQYHLHDAPDHLIDAEDGEMAEPPVPAPVAPTSDPAAAKAHARKRYFGLRPTLVVIAVLNAILLLALLGYFAILMTYFTFTFDPQFPQSTVPFYEEPASDAVHRQADRLHLWWWIVVIQLLRVFTLVGTHMALAHGAVTGQRLPVQIMQWGTLLYGLLELAGVIFYLVVLFVPAKCAAVPVCRSWDAKPGDPSDVAGKPNWVFHLLTWGSVAFLGVFIGYFIVLLRANATLVRAAASVNSARQGAKKN